MNKRIKVINKNNILTILSSFTFTPQQYQTIKGLSNETKR